MIFKKINELYKQTNVAFDHWRETDEVRLTGETKISEENFGGEGTMMLIVKSENI